MENLLKNMEKILKIYGFIIKHRYSKYGEIIKKYGEIINCWRIYFMELLS